MKKLLIFFVFSTGLFAQFSRTASYIVHAPSLPATCSPTTGAVYFDDTGAGLGPYYCSAVNTWSPMFASAGAGVTTGVTLTADLPVIGAGGSAIAVGTKTGTGTTFVTNTSPTLVAPTLGVALATSINGLTITTSTGTLTITNAKTLSVSNTLTFTGTDSSSVAFGTGGTVAYVGAANAWADGVKQTFNPDATNSGFNVGSIAGDPSTPANGDVWYDSTANELTARINGANVALGASGGGVASISGLTGTVLMDSCFGTSSNTITFVPGCLTTIPTLAGPNTFTAGGTNTFQNSATTWGARFTPSAVPSVRLAGGFGVKTTGELMWDNGTAVGIITNPATAERTWTMQDASYTVVGRDTTDTLTNKTLTTPTISGAIVFPDNVTQVFNPGATVAGLDVGSIAGDPSTPTNGMIWYDSTANELTARINGANVALGAGSSVAHYYTSTTFTGIGPTSFTPAKTLTVYDATASTGSTNMLLQSGAGQSGNLLNFRGNSANDVGFRQTTNGRLDVLLADQSDFAEISAKVFSFSGGTAISQVSSGVSLGDSSSGPARASIMMSIGSGASVTGCSATLGTGSASGAGFITSGTTGTCTPVLTTGKTVLTGYSCSISNQTTANLIRQTASTTTTVTFEGTTVTGDVLAYSCQAY